MGVRYSPLRRKKLEQILQYKDTILEIKADEFLESPRDWDNMGTMAYSHSQYNLGDEKIDNTWEQYLESKDIESKDLAVILPLYIYDHSGISMTCGDRVYPYNDSWDSSMVGFIYVTKQKLREEFHVKKISKKIIEKAVKILKGEVKTFDQYLQGDVYGFVISKISKCDMNHEHKEHVDSCWGFYGYDMNKNGMKDHIPDFERFKEITQ